MEWIKTITELIKALAPFAWPILVGLIVLWFRKEIPKALAVIARISKFKGFGLEFETREEFQQAMKEVGIPKDKVKELKDQVEPALLVTAQGTITTSGAAKFNLLEGLDLLTIKKAA